MSNRNDDLLLALQLSILEKIDGKDPIVNITRVDNKLVIENKRGGITGIDLPEFQTINEDELKSSILNTVKTDVDTVISNYDFELADKLEALKADVQDSVKSIRTDAQSELKRLDNAVIDLVKTEIIKSESSFSDKVEDIKKTTVDIATFSHVVEDLKLKLDSLEKSKLAIKIPKPKDGVDGKDGLSIKGDKGDVGIGEKGQRGNSIIDIKLDQRGHLIMTTDDKTFDLGPMRYSHGGGSASSGDSSFTYTNTLPMPTTVGGWPAGSTFSNVGLNELWTTLLYAYPFPNFSLFTIGSIVSLIEVGDIIIAGNYSANWLINNPQMLANNSIDINYITGNIQLANNLPDMPPQNIILPAISFNVPTPVIFRISAMDTTGGTFSRDFIVNFVSRIYIGESLLSSLVEADIKALRIRELAETVDGDYDLLGGGYKWFCYPVTMGLRSDFHDVVTNYAIAMNTVETVSVTNDYGITEDYYCYRTFNILGGDISIGISS